MRFRKIFNKYINEEATEEERYVVENEIEKFETLNDYLAEKLDNDVLHEKEFDNIEDTFIEHNIKDVEEDKDYSHNKKFKVLKKNKKESDLLIEIKKAINRKLRNTALFSIISVMILLLSFNFIVSPIMNKIYYNPNEMVDNYSRNIDLDLDVFSELHLPGVSTGQVWVNSLGFGKYDLTINQYDYFENKTSSYKSELERNKFNIDEGFYKYLSAGVFTRGMVPFYQYPGDKDSEDEIKELKVLPEYVRVKADISFAKDLNTKEVMELISNRNIDTYWVGVRSCNVDNQRYPYSGFNPSGLGIVFEKEAIDEEKYPYLELGWVNEEDITSEILEQHFKSLLKYMSDNEAFGNTDILYKTSKEHYREALEYINKNGVKSYGIVVSGSPKEILRLIEKPIVEDIYIENIKLSSMSH